MPIRTQPAPTAAMTSLREAQTWQEAGGVRAASAPAVLEGEPARLPPHPLYYLGASQLVAGSMQAAVLIGWRHLVEEQGTLWAAVTESVEDRSYRLARKHQLDAVEARFSRMDALDGLVPGRDDYGLRALAAPPLMSLGLWLVEPLQRDNLIIPLHGCVRGLALGEACTEARFLELVQGPARTLMEFVPRPRTRQQPEAQND
jgi:hypothetical protein